jgi:predicted NAD/FAD-binding protein
VDTGFLVFNYANYPLLTGLFDELSVPVVKSDMSFGASISGGRLEYALATLDAMFAQRKNALNPAFLRMIRDILYFNKHALKVAQADRNLTTGAFLEKMGMGPYFRDYYLAPLSGAIWSTPVDKIMDFPAHAMMQFFENHALLQNSGQHQWYTVDGGSVEYVRRLEVAMKQRGVDIRTGAAIESVTRSAGAVQLKTYGQDWMGFDEVVFATHSDDSLAMLGDARGHETAALSAIKYQPNDVVLHCDDSIMPTSRKVWSSWNYTEDAQKASDRIDLTYWINKLQPVPKDDPHFVTLNTKRTIREDCIYDQTVLRHPVYDLAALAAQDTVRTFNGTDNTWFCGAWMRHGFHEDGLASGIEVADTINARTQIKVAAE